MSKRMKALSGMGSKKPVPLAEAVAAVKKTATAKFPESVDVALKTGIDGKKTDQSVRGTVVLPHGTGRSVRVIVFAKGEKEAEARSAGANETGAEELIDKVAKGWMEFDVAIATPDMMKDVGKLGKILGPKGLLPNPKSGTVTFDIARAVKDCRGGRVEFRSDAGGIIHGMVGKASFTEQQLAENTVTFLEAVAKLKPSTVKGEYLTGMAMSSTMGPSVRVDLRSALMEKEPA